ncbi:MAG: DUF4922 domain-containing protein [Bacteroidales bacterium]|nr:DUF4922 domain-containing protein [Candidatus Liminaster caballi]
MINLDQFFNQQLAVWPEAQQRYRDLSQASHKTIMIGGRDYDVMFNPARMKSAAAKVDNGKVARPCFLCQDALPKEQNRIEVKAIPSGNMYNIMVNPFPITDHHFTIVANQHTPQDFSGRHWDMAFLADLMPDYLIFFNGACSGASAPDHMHFQAVPKHLVPLTHWSWQEQLDMGVTSVMPKTAPADDPHYMNKNVVCWTDGQDCHWLVIDRKCHRPSQYPDTLLISPASLEFCGLVPMARQDDFDRLDATLLADVLGQCRRQEPMIHVGVMEGQQIRFSAEERTHALNYLADGRMLHVMDYGSNRAEKHEIEEYRTHSQPFTLEGVTIGKQFHWQQQEDQSFMGSLRVIAAEGQLHAINTVPVEEYLKSVISSEMSAMNNLELLKTHAIISRSWVMRQIANSHQPDASDARHKSDNVIIKADNAIVKFWDHSDHTLFDVCADDHCQRYQGITRQNSPLVNQAIDETRGMVLIDPSDGSVCDARFSKCCGGRSELFSACWQDRDYGYLQPVDDPWCDTSDERVLRLVLNDYDQHTHDFHDWTVTYSQSQISELVCRRLLAEFPDPDSDVHRRIAAIGKIISFEPLQRGPSGRIVTLRITGEGGSITIGKELLIRKALSESHLYSSAFDVSVTDDAVTGEKVFTLTGKGWGHGVGLCQIGAANMSQNGFDYQQILAHYFTGAEIRKIY